MKNQIYNYENRLVPSDIYPEIEKCCDNPCVKYKDGSKVCINCGTTLGRDFVICERRAYTIEEIRKKRQTEPSWRDFGPRTILPCNKKDSMGKLLNATKRYKFSRLSKIQRSLISSIERNYWEAQPKLKIFSSKLNIPDYVSETAWRIYIEAAKRKLTMGRSIDAFIAASLYAAIRINNFPRLLEDVSDVVMIPNRTLFRALGMIFNEILPTLGLEYHPITAEKLVFVFGNKLGLPIELQVTAMNILKNDLEKKLCNGKDPKGLAAAVLYFVAKDTVFKKKQAEVAKVAKVTEVTLRSRLKDISIFLDKFN
ncbi:MAG: transcription initiation factor IIB family protein [Promethearchaeota archaeon]